MDDPGNKPNGAYVLNLAKKLPVPGNWLFPLVLPLAGQAMRQARIVLILTLDGSECSEAS